MKVTIYKILFSLIILFLMNGHIMAQSLDKYSQDQNYVLTRTYTNNKGTKYLDVIQYYDGLGRPVQTVQRGITPTKKDLITLQEYDSYGREDKSWLPVASSKNGLYTLPTEVKNIAVGASMHNDANPYSSPVYEDSPLNRISAQYGPGAKWYRDQKVIGSKYLTNNNSYPCLWFSVKGDRLSNEGGYYSAGALYVTEIKDEDNNTNYEFKNARGQVLLTRQLNGNEKYDTYYIYDDYGNLRYVLPPSAVDNLSKGLADNSEMMQQYVYIYKYDHRNRCIWKKLPGIEPIYYVYDNVNQLIFTQDGEQRLKGEWLFNIPDALGRTVITGICKNNINQSNYPTYLGNKTITATFNNGTYRGYSINGDLTLNNWTLMTVNYYDNYDHLQLSGFNNTNLSYMPNSGYGTRYGENDSRYEHKGLLTGTIVATLGEQPMELYSVMYYDYKKRVVQSRSTNHLTGYDLVFTAYNFVGNPTRMLSEHQVMVNGRTVTTKELYTYRYDHAGRLKETRHRLNDGRTVMATLHEYDELGRVKSTNRNTYEEITNP